MQQEEEKYKSLLVKIVRGLEGKGDDEQQGLGIQKFLHLSTGLFGGCSQCLGQQYSLQNYLLQLY